MLVKIDTVSDKEIISEVLELKKHKVIYSIYYVGEIENLEQLLKFQKEQNKSLIIDVEDNVLNITIYDDRI